ncbi:MAG: phosphoglycerate kinase [Candidatus Dojkabacteria bacterium]
MYNLKKDLDKYSYLNIQDIENKTIIVRSCLNVAVDKEGRMEDSTRFYESLPLIKELAEKAKKVIVMGHLGRPERRDKSLSFWNIAEVLTTELEEQRVEVELVDSLGKIGKKETHNPETHNLDTHNLDTHNLETHNYASVKAQRKKIILIDNIRFFPGEESKNKDVRMAFAKELASLADVFVNDAFADYRESASTYDIATLLPSYLGPVFMKEVAALSKFSQPESPFVAVLGGAKLSEKLDALNALVQIADKVIIGGAMAYTIMKAIGVETGNSLIEKDKLEIATEIMNKYSEKILLPVDHLVAQEFKLKSPYEYTETEVVPADMVAIDIGWNSIRKFKTEISNSKSILWNGPMGVFEWIHSSVGTKEIGSAIAENTSAYSLAGGGDSIAAINKFNLRGFDHVSTGGGAMLAFLAYDKFPTLDVILNK